MKKAYFQSNQVKTLIQYAESHNQPILLVGDQGIYLMVDGQNGDENLVAYANKCDPSKNEDWMDQKNRIWGQDDGGETYPTSHFTNAMARKTVQINISKDSIAILQN